MPHSTERLERGGSTPAFTHNGVFRESAHPTLKSGWDQAFSLPEKGE